MSTKFHPVAAARSRIKSAAVSALVISLVLFGLLFLALTIVPRWILDESIRRNGQPVPVSDRINAENDVRMALVHYAKAEGAVLADAQLYCAHLEGANLQGANLKGSKLKKAVLIGAPTGSIRAAHAADQAREHGHGLELCARFR